MYYQKEMEDINEKEEDIYSNYGEGFEKEQKEKENDEWYDKAFEEAKPKRKTKKGKEEDYEYDQVGLNKRNPMNKLNKTKIDEKELEELLNTE